MAARKPKIELYWTGTAQPVVNWRLVGANGEVVCQCTQGFRDKADAMRNLTWLAGFFAGDVDKARIVGPGRKPNA